MYVITEHLSNSENNRRVFRLNVLTVLMVMALVHTISAIANKECECENFEHRYLLFATATGLLSHVHTERQHQRRRMEGPHLFILAPFTPSTSVRVDAHCE